MAQVQNNLVRHDRISDFNKNMIRVEFFLQSIILRRYFIYRAYLVVFSETIEEY